MTIHMNFCSTFFVFIYGLVIKSDKIAMSTYIGTRLLQPKLVSGLYQTSNYVHADFK